MGLFKSVEKEFLQEVVTKLHFETYVPGDVIFRAGQVGRKMYIVTKGEGGHVGEARVVVVKFCPATWP